MRGGGSCLSGVTAYNLAGSYRPPVALEEGVQGEEPGPKAAARAGVRIPALRKSYQEAAVPKVAGDQPVEAEVRTRGSLEAHRGGTHEVPAHWGQYTACSCALAAERWLSAAAGPGEECFRGRRILESQDRGPRSRRRRKHLVVNAVCLGLQNKSRLQGPWGSAVLAPRAPSSASPWTASPFYPLSSPLASPPVSPPPSAPFPFCPCIP